MRIEAVSLLQFSAQNWYNITSAKFFWSEQIIRLAQIQGVGKQSIPLRETENNLWHFSSLTDFSSHRQIAVFLSHSLAQGILSALAEVTKTLSWASHLRGEVIGQGGFLPGLGSLYEGHFIICAGGTGEVRWDIPKGL